MFPGKIEAGNIIRIPSGHIKETNWQGKIDNASLEKLIESNMSASIQILKKDKVIGTWEVQAFGFQAGYNVCVSTNMDVLSGFFSGCLMASYKKEGQRRVAHVYTEDGGGKAKKAFMDTVKEGSISCLFKPVWRAPAQQCLGVITKNDECYSVGIQSLGSATDYKIAYIEKVLPPISLLK